MGCTAEKEKVDVRPLEVRYKAAGYAVPFSCDYENDFEKQIFYAINMLRAKPKTFVTHVQRVHQKSLTDKSKSLSVIITALKNMSALSQLRFDDAANEAVRANNQKVTESAE